MSTFSTTTVHKPIANASRAPISSCKFLGKRKYLNKYPVHPYGEELSYVIAHGRPEEDRQTDSDEMRACPWISFSSAKSKSKRRSP